VIAHNRLRSLLHEYFPALLAAFASKRGGLMRPEARALLAAVSTPATAARLTVTQLVAVLRRAGRVRQLSAEAARLQAVRRADYLHQPSAVEQAWASTPSLYWLCSMPHATTPSPSQRPPPSHFAPTPTRRSSPASLAKASSPEHEFSARSVTTVPDSPTLAV
jgi:hypothetical protein